MISDITGIVLIPGNCGKDCPGSWELAGYDCCCDECDYMLCCLESHDAQECLKCSDRECPRSPNVTERS
jgi:hypothetical protein